VPDAEAIERAAFASRPQKLSGAALEVLAVISYRQPVGRAEIEEISQKYGDKRRTTIESDTSEQEYTADDFIVEEDNVVIISRDGWVKRQKEVKDIASTRVREGDAVLTAAPGSTREPKTRCRRRHVLESSASPARPRPRRLPGDTGFDHLQSGDSLP